MNKQRRKITKWMFLLISFFVMTFMTAKEVKAARRIEIDGYYDDWANVPMTEITYYSNNQLCLNYSALVKDGEYLYFYVEMNELYNSSIPIDSYYLNINNKTLQFFVRYPTTDGNGIDWGKNVDLSQDGTYKGLSPFTSYPSYSWGNAVITVSSGYPNDRMEIAMKISDVAKLMNIPAGEIESGAKISIAMPNVGSGTVTVVGTSTGAVLSIILLVLAAASAYVSKMIKERKLI